MQNWGRTIQPACYVFLIHLIYRLEKRVLSFINRLLDRNPQPAYVIFFLPLNYFNQHRKFTDACYSPFECSEGAISYRFPPVISPFKPFSNGGTSTDINITTTCLLTRPSPHSPPPLPPPHTPHPITCTMYPYVHVHLISCPCHFELFLAISITSLLYIIRSDRFAASHSGGFATPPSWTRSPCLDRPPFPAHHTLS